MKTLVILIFFANSASYLAACQCRLSGEDENSSFCCMKTEQKSCCSTEKTPISNMVQLNGQRHCSKHNHTMADQAIFMSSEKTEGLKWFSLSFFLAENMGEHIAFLTTKPLKAQLFTNYPSPPNLFKLCRLTC